MTQNVAKALSQVVVSRKSKKSRQNPAVLSQNTSMPSITATQKKLSSMYNYLICRIKKKILIGTR